MEKTMFTPEEIAYFSMINAESAWLASFSYLKSKGYDLSEWLDYVGDLYKNGWDSLEGKGALSVTRQAALNWVSCGAELDSISGDDKKAIAVVTWPSDDVALLFGLNKSDCHQINKVFGPIAEKLGLHFSWESEGDKFIITFAK